MIVKLLREARLDLFEASRFYDRQGDGLGDYFVKCIFEDIERLEAFAGIHERRGSYLRILSKRFPRQHLGFESPDFIRMAPITRLSDATYPDGYDKRAQ